MDKKVIVLVTGMGIDKGVFIQGIINEEPILSELVEVVMIADDDSSYPIGTSSIDVKMAELLKEADSILKSIEINDKDYRSLEFDNHAWKKSNKRNHPAFRKR